MISYQNFKMQYCPECKTKLEPGDEPYSVRCPKDDKALFFNPGPCVNIYIVKEGRVLMGKRAIEPFKGTIDIVGGFIDWDENAEEAAIREAQEETGLSVSITKYLGSAKDYYGSSDSPLVCLAFLAIMNDENQKPNANDDIAELFWHPLDKPVPDCSFSSAAYFFDLVKKAI